MPEHAFSQSLGFLCIPESKERGGDAGFTATPAPNAQRELQVTNAPIAVNASRNAGQFRSEMLGILLGV